MSSGRTPTRSPCGRPSWVKAPRSRSSSSRSSSWSSCFSSGTSGGATDDGRPVREPPQARGHVLHSLAAVGRLDAVSVLLVGVTFILPRLLLFNLKMNSFLTLDPALNQFY